MDKLTWNTEISKISDLIAYEKNPRRLTDKQYEDLKNSLTRFGLVEIPAIDFDGTIIAGHMRLKILAEIEGGDYEIDIRRPNRKLTVKEFQEYNIRSNKNSGEFDFDILANEFEIEDLLDWGFEEEELVGFEEDDEGTGTEDDTPGKPEISRTQLGDIYELGKHRVMCGDSTDKEIVEALMDGNKADMVFTDPPYGVDYTGGMKKQERLVNDNLGTNIYSMFMSHAVAVLKDDGAFYVWYADATATATATATEEAGLKISAQIIWAKNHAQFMSAAKYKGKHEPCFYAHKKGNSAKWYGENNEVTLWQYDRASKNEYHPTQKPVSLAERASKNSSPKAGIILDLFLGSGSTLIACEKTKRRCYGMELDPKYVDVIVQRYVDYTGNSKIKLNGESIEWELK